MSRQPLDACEQILRALTESDWDFNKDRVSSGAIRKRHPEMSVGRLAILSQPQLFEIFRRDISDLIGAAQWEVGELVRLAREVGIQLQVVDDPIPSGPDANPAHALILGNENIKTRGQAKKILSGAAFVADQRRL